MEYALELAGFFAAHSIWCVSDGEALIPMLAQESTTGERNMIRFNAEQLEDGVAQAKAHLESNPDNSSSAVLVFDGYITLPTGQTDALILVIHTYLNAVATLTMAIPYRNANSPNGFAVHRPKFIEWKGSGDPDYTALAEAFFRGVDSHEKGAAVWKKYANDAI